MSAERVVVSGTAALAVFEHGAAPAEAPTVVLAHGWPDSHEVWDLVATRLAGRFHVVSYDMRGVGRSTAALERHPYTLDRLAADLDAVVTAVSPGRPAHVVGHDWGSVVGWEYVQTPAFAAHAASFTSVSGPNLDFAGWLLRQGRWRDGAGALLDQVARSGYTTVLSLPVLRTAMWRLGMDRLLRAWLRWSEGVTGYPGPGLVRDAVAAVPIYRSNILPRLRRPELRDTSVPVQVVVAARDRYVSPRLAKLTVRRWLPTATVEEIDAGHWSPRTRPDVLAALIAGHVDRNETAGTTSGPA